MPLPFILSRSTFAGSGKYCFHWTGDSESNFGFLKCSLTGLLLFNIFGIPMVGADIGGFFCDSNPYLCSRWI
jgi:alpha-glucosidase (family GH31 glycosyl hydrolase)